MTGELRSETLNDLLPLDSLTRLVDLARQNGPD